MSSPATYDDVNLILRLYEERRENKLREAREWFAAHFFVNSLEELQHLCPVGSQTNAYFRMVVSYWEMVASFVTAGVLNEELFFQSGRELLFVWVRIRAVVPQYRAATKNPNEWRNLETVAERFIRYMNRAHAEAFDAFAARILGLAVKR